MDIHRYRESHCPNCNQLLNAGATPDNERPPQPGDIAICMGCHHLGAYADDMQVRNLTDEEMIDIAGDPDLISMMEGLRLRKMLMEILKND